MNDVISLSAIVLFDQSHVHGVHMHGLPRSLFDLIPGEEREVTAPMRNFWTKTLTLACEPGKHIEMMVYCQERPLVPAAH
jgi:hypothetical protein